MAGFEFGLEAGERAVHAFSRDEYLQMGELGMLGERTELIEGVIFDMSPAGPLHSSLVFRLTRLLGPILGDRFILGVQTPVVIPPRSEPMPDLTVMTHREDYYASALPRPGDVALLIEISDTTLRHDQWKAGVYAAAGIPEYWLIDVRAGVVLVHADPSAQGYRSVERRGRGDVLEPLFGGRLAVSEFLLP